MVRMTPFCHADLCLPDGEEASLALGDSSPSAQNDIGQKLHWYLRMTPPFLTVSNGVEMCRMMSKIIKNTH